MPIDAQAIILEIDQALDEWRVLSPKSKYDDYSDLSEIEVTSLINRLASTIERFAPPGSHHKRNLVQVLARPGFPSFNLPALVGALTALRREYELGHLQSFSELVHADTFADFMEMASHLRDQGYKDPAAVIAGSVLEQHLRELCSKNQLSVDIRGKHKKAEAMNTELAGQGIYSKLDQKNVTSEMMRLTEGTAATPNNK